jgi:curli biogenesis system outer membrane secretion channel CsgG
MHSSNRKPHALVATLLLALLVAVVGPSLAQDKPRIAVLEFEAKADQQWYGWWRSGGSSAVQDVMVTELVKSGKFRVIEREKLDALMREKNLSLSGDVSVDTAIKAGRLLGVKYFVTGAITEYGEEGADVRAPSVGKLPSFGVGKKTFTAAINARIIDTETGEIMWADDARGEAKSGRVRVGGFGGGKDGNNMFDKVLKPTVQDLVASIKMADL